MRNFLLQSSCRAGEMSAQGPCVAATTATAVFGGLAPYAAHRLLALTGSPLVPGAMMAVVALGVLPLLLAMPETAAGNAPIK